MDGMDDITYQQICSAATVQSDKKGFFHEFFVEAMSTAGPKWLQHCFGQLKSNEARILAIFSDREVCDTVLGVLENVKPVFKQKDGTISSQRRAMADKHHLLGDYKQALMFANVAVVRAPAKGVDMDIDDGLSLALALRSRAAILTALGNGASALSDLKLAAAYGLESKQSVDYYLKMARAYAVMGELARAEISLNIAQKLAGADIGAVQACRQELPTLTLQGLKTPANPQAPDLALGEHPELPGASRKLKLAQTPNQGRFMVSAEPLRTGDVVLCEEPVAACLLPSFYGSHCHHCLKRLVVPVPCTQCSGIAFCSAQCMGEACDSYHRFECPFLDLLLGSGMSILCYIALRVFTQARGVEQALATAQQLNANLVSHDETRKPDDQLQRSLMAGFLMRVLQQGQYFGRRRTEGVNPTAVELQVGAALLSLLQLLQYNAHEIYETLQDAEHRYDKSRMVYVGAGLYGKGAYFNHECFPSVTRYFVGKQLVLAAIRPHGVNEVVAENYGPIFTKMHLKERQRALRARYQFNCGCMACQENWPSLQKLDKQVRLRCPSSNCGNLIRCPRDLSKDVRCVRCRKNVSFKERVVQLIKVEELYREAAQAMEKQQTETAIELFKEAIDSFFEIAALPHKDTLYAQQSLMKCFADTGTTFQMT